MSTSPTTGTVHAEWHASSSPARRAGWANWRPRHCSRPGTRSSCTPAAPIASGPTVNVIAPYLLTALIDRPRRLVYLTSGMQDGGRADLDWSAGRVSYSDSKLLVTTFAFAVARLWPGVYSNAVDPGWVPTRMGGPNAPDDLGLGHLTQQWLATSDDDDARTSGGLWYHQQRRTPPRATLDLRFQDELLATLADVTGTPLP